MTVNNNYLKSRDGTDNQSRATRLTKRETVSYMHATVTGVRQTGAFWVMGADRTQSIALDELFSKKPINDDGAERKTVTLRATKSMRNTKIEMSSASNSDDEEEEIEVPTSVMARPGLFRGRTGVNLILMVILWVITLFSYSLINFYLKHLPGSIYINLTVSGFSEILAHVIVGAFFVKLTPRWTFFIGYAAAILGGVLLLFQDRYEDNTGLVAVIVVFAKLGMSMSMCACYISTPYIFPILFAGTAFGICNAFGRAAAVLAPG